MFRRVQIPAVLCVWLLLGCGQRPTSAAPAAEPLPAVPLVPADDAEADLLEFLAAVGDLHPNPFWSRSRRQVESDIAAVVADARGRGGLTRQEWYKAASRVVVSLDDPHMWAFVPGWADHVKAGGKLFPLDLRVRGQTVTVIDGDPALLGADVVRINGEPAAALVAAFRPLAGQADDPYGDVFLAGYFARYLWFFRGWGDSFRLIVRDATGEREVVLPGLDAETAQARRAAPVAPLAYRDLAGGVGLLEFRQCVSGDRIRELAAPIFRAIRAKGVTRLVVDARENGGGGDDAWWALLDYLTDKPHTAYSGSRFRVTRRMKDMLGEKRVREGFADEAWSAPDGKEFASKFDPADLRKPDDPANKYRGAWCVLAGRGTFSAGMSFVCAVKAYKLAPVVGEETGGRVKGFGQWERVTLPRTGLQVAVSLKEFVGAVDVPYRRGVPPDLEVSPSAQTRSGDRVLDVALDLLGKTAK